jgi:hypothetical protein
MASLRWLGSGVGELSELDRTLENNPCLVALQATLTGDNTHDPHIRTCILHERHADSGGQSWYGQTYRLA